MGRPWPGAALGLRMPALPAAWQTGTRARISFLQLALLAMAR